MIMAMHPKKGIWLNNRTTAPGAGITNDPDDPALKDRVADFSYTSNELAILITEIWLNQHPTLLRPVANYAARSAAAQTALRAKGIHLTKPIVVTEDEFNEGFSLGSAGLAPDGVVLVVPRD